MIITNYFTANPETEAADEIKAGVCIHAGFWFACM